jgi:glycoside/pentoside/hexuronide:cation symporter, GPH family
VPLLPWAAASLVVAYLAYSLLGVSHQAWGARQGGDTVQQTRLVAWREGFALAGVLIASVLISEAGWALTSGVLMLALALGLWALLSLRVPRSAMTQAAPIAWGLPWRTAGFKPLLAVYAVNGIAAAVPATVLLFFVKDRLQAPEQQAGFLMAYFLAAALSLPLWLRIVARVGAVRAWAAGMALAIAAFVWAYFLGSGDVAAFYVICLVTGLAVGADLSIPPALLTGVVQRAGLAQQAEGAFFGWWAATTKLNLALAAGLALPLLQGLGYATATVDPQGLQALSAVYALLPCALKLVALALLFVLLERKSP